MPVSQRQARVFKPTKRNLSLLAGALRRGEIVAAPTETVYGLAGNGLKAEACLKIFHAKGRPANDPLILHIHEVAQWSEVAHLNAAAEAVAKAFWPGPLTIVLPKKQVVPDEATSGLPSVAVRMPAHPLFKKLLKLCGFPLAAPSANPFGYISPTEAGHVLESLGGKIPYILDGGSCEIGLESTILDLRDPAHPAILRPGAITAEALGRVLHRTVATPHLNVAKKRAALAPGLLTRHYSPKTGLTLHDKIPLETLAAIKVDEAVLLLFKPTGKQRVHKNVFWLSERRRLDHVGRRLFGALRELDAGKWKHIHVEMAPPGHALSPAINDRLTRAAAKR